MVLSALPPVRRRLLLGIAAALVAGVLVAVILVVVNRAGSSSGPVRCGRTSRGRCCWCPGTAGRRRRWTCWPRGFARPAAGEVVRLPGDGTGDLRDQADGAGPGGRRRSPAGRRRSTWSATRPAGWWPGCGRRGRRRRHRPPDRHARLAAPRQRDRRAGRVAAAGPVPGGVPPARPGQRPADPAQRTREPAGPAWVSVWTEQDQVVTPPDSARLDGALNIPVQCVCAGAQLATATSAATSSSPSSHRPRPHPPAPPADCPAVDADAPVTSDQPGQGRCPYPARKIERGEVSQRTACLDSSIQYEAPGGRRLTTVDQPVDVSQLSG